MGPLARFGTRLGQQTVLYASSSVATFAFAVVQLAILTRHLSLEEFAALALLNLFAALLTVLYNLGSLQGTLLAVFGEGDEGVQDAASEISRDEVRRALGTGLVVTVLTGVVGTALVAVAAAPLSDLLFSDEPVTAGLIVLAAGTGAIGAVWRFAVNVPRFERRAWVFAGLNSLRPVLVLAGSAGLVIAGYGVEGALVGTAAATLVGTVVTVAVSRRNYELALDRRLAGHIWRRGTFTIPFIALIWVVHNVDLYVVSLFGTAPDVARYRVAARIGAGMSYFVSALLMALGPLTNTALYAGITRRAEGRDPGGALTTYFLVVALWLVLALGVLADVLIRIAPQDYAEVAPLIPIVALGFVAFGMYTLIQRLGQLPDKRRRVVQFAAAAAGVFLAGSFVLVPLVGSVGAPIAQITAFTVVGVVALWLQHRDGTPLPIEGERVAKALVAGGACLVASQVDLGLERDLEALLDVFLLALFPAALILAGVTPPAEIRALVGGLRRRRAAPDIGAGLKAQPDHRVRSLALLVREGRDPETAAAAMGASTEVVLAEAVRTLRRIAGGENDSDADSDIGSYLFSRRSPAEQDHLARRLWLSGADPLDVERMEAVRDELRRLPPRAWP